MPKKETVIMKIRHIEGALDFKMGSFEDVLEVESFEDSLEVGTFKDSLKWRSLEGAWGPWLKDSGEGVRGFKE